MELVKLCVQRESVRLMYTRWFCVYEFLVLVNKFNQTFFNVATISTDEVAFNHFFFQVVDIIVHMLDFKQLKDRGITEAFPSIFK